MNTKDRFERTISAAACALAIGALGASCGSASAQQVSIDVLERAFWACDYVATTRGVDAAPVTACRAATDRLLDDKFGGDFLRMLEWWRENKPAVHARLEAEDGDTGSRNVGW